MVELSKLEKVDSDYNLSSNWHSGGLEKEVLEKICVADKHVNGLQEQKIGESDSFVMDMARFSHPIEKDINANSRLTLLRNLSRKGVGKGGDKKFNKAANLNETTSPRATLHGGNSTPEKPMVVGNGATDQPQVHHHHHQITITNGGRTPTAAESKLGGKRFSFRRSPHSTWSINPGRILLFFATVSSIGTILLIYFTFSMSKPADGSSLDS